MCFEYTKKEYETLKEKKMNKKDSTIEDLKQYVNSFQS